MAYFDIALITRDVDFAARVAACYATEVQGQTDVLNAQAWAAQNIWQVAAAPGFGDAWASALAAENPAPGTDPGVITDGMILGAVQPLLAPTAPPE